MFETMSQRTDFKKIIKNLFLSAAVTAVSVLSSFSVSAADVNGISVTKDNTVQGDEFDIVLYVPPTENADTASVKVTYDESAFEVTKWAPDIQGSFSNMANGIIALSAANVDRVIGLENGLTVTASIKVKDNAPDGVYSFELVDSSLSFFNEETADFDELWFPEVRSVSVIVGTGISPENDDTVDIIDIEEPESEIPEITDTTSAFTPDDASAGTAPAQTPPAQANGKTVAIIVTLALAAVLTLVLLILSKLRK